ncbi:MAG: 3-methyl-2-oxobutanoate hydroxymethyltransferase [Fimbriimonadales bacterium]
MSDKITAPKIRSMKGERIVCVTAYDTPSAQIADEAGVDVILVGDSVGNTTLGYATTLPVTLEEMVHHTRAAAAGCERALLVADLPFGSYQSSSSHAVDSAVALVKAGAEAVKLEGAYTEAIQAIVRAGIPLMGHVGMTPQSVNAFGGFRVQGRGDKAEAVISAANAVEDAGAFSMVLEVIPAVVAKRVTGAVGVPTIGIGAGIECDGEIQVWHDVLGISAEVFKHAKPFMAGRSLMKQALADFANAVRNREFPTEDNSF